MNLITVSRPEQMLSRSLLKTRGGFAWWYADALDARGNGIVLIWSYGLPFLPGIASGARRGRPVLPATRPSLNVSIYREGALDCYLLQELQPDEARWVDDTHWQFGNSRMESRRDGGRHLLQVDLDCPLPGTRERLRGSVTIEGAARQSTYQDHTDPTHDWTPLMGPATASVDLRAPGERYRFEGRGYHDRNGGTHPLHDLGFDRWIWGRMPLHDREMIYYILWPKGQGAPTCLGMVVHEDGRTETFEDMTLESSRPSIDVAGGMRHDRHLELLVGGRPWLTLDTEHVLDHGPFYLRFFQRAHTPEGEEALGVAEICRPDMIDRRRHRPLVKMRVGRPASDDDSMWLPLFTGPRSGRLRRFLAHNRPF